MKSDDDDDDDDSTITVAVTMAWKKDVQTQFCLFRMTLRANVGGASRKL